MAVQTPTHSSTTQRSANNGTGRLRLGREARHIVSLYAYERSGIWYAEALDIALLARGRTQEEALDRLVEQLHGYIDVATERGWWTSSHRKPVSLGHRLQVYARVLLTKLRHTRIGLSSRKVPLA